MYFNWARIDHEKSENFMPFDPSTLKIPRIPKRPIAITKKHMSFVSDVFDISQRSSLTWKSIICHQRRVRHLDSSGNG